MGWGEVELLSQESVSTSPAGAGAVAGDRSGARQPVIAGPTILHEIVRAEPGVR
jgi:hypothetical protein